MNTMTDRQIDMLRNICSQSDVSSVCLTQKAIDGVMDVNEIAKLCELISGELLMKGVGPDFEPNIYGKELETLLDSINRKRLGK